MAHLARVAAAGEMATSLAHELNQPLGAITNYAGVCLDAVRPSNPLGPTFLEALEEIRKEAARASEIIRRLRAFLRKREPQRQPVNINEVVREAADMLAFDLRHNGVQARLQLAEGLPMIRVDAVQIQQVLVNLIQNGVDAMVDTRSHERRLAIKTVAAERGAVQVHVSDSGCGIAEDMWTRLFQGFATTKPNGLGMGLAICRTIVEAHGGRIWAVANPGQGATFRFALPNE